MKQEQIDPYNFYTDEKTGKLTVANRTASDSELSTGAKDIAVEKLGQLYYFEDSTSNIKPGGIILIDVMRKTCAAGVQEEFRFAASAVAFRVKNFTGDKILVCLGEKWDETQNVRINSNMAETLVLNPDPERGNIRGNVDTVIVQAVSEGEVEVMRDD